MSVRLDTFLISLLVLLLFLIGGTLIINEQIEQYDTDVTNKHFNNTKNLTDTLLNLGGKSDSTLNEMQEDLQKEGGFKAIDTLAFLLQGGYKVLLGV